MSPAAIPSAGAAVGRRTRARRRGYTLAELMVAMGLFGVVTSVGVAFLLRQSAGMRALALRSAQVQRARVARDVLRQELRTAGTQVLETQPLLVLANDSTFAFNADLLTNRADGAQFTGAVYVDPYASGAEAQALRPSQRIAVPGSNPVVTYPLGDYTQVAGTPGDAELVIFRFVTDTAVPGGAEFALLRQVNGEPAQVVATGLRRAGTTPFFRYWHDPTRTGSTLTALDTVPRGWLPLAKTVAQRGVAPDTGTAVSTRIDAVRAVEVTYETMAPRNGRRDVVRFTVPLPNTAMPRQSRACGRPPTAPAGLAGGWNADSGAVLLSWGKATDDGASEQDAVRYVLWRRLAGATVWPEPLATIGAVAGTTLYRHSDASVERGASYQYAVAVQDCTPNLSGLATSATVPVPALPP